MGLAPRNRGLIRQWKLIRALEAAHMGLTFAQLIDAADESVSLRTIRRDIDTLTFAGFPIDVVSGEGMTSSRIYLRNRRLSHSSWRVGQLIASLAVRAQE